MDMSSSGLSPAVMRERQRLEEHNGIMVNGSVVITPTHRIATVCKVLPGDPDRVEVLYHDDGGGAIVPVHILKLRQAAQKYARFRRDERDGE